MAEVKTISNIIEEVTPIVNWMRNHVDKQYEAEQERGFVEFEVILDCEGSPGRRRSRANRI
jgi:hypothetical protein|nr:hypothetical protein [uncultured Lachnoclostridium sp.]